MSRRTRSSTFDNARGTEEAFAIARRGHTDSIPEPGRVSEIVRAYCAAEPGPFDRELTLTARLEAWAVKMRALTDDLDPSGPIDISDVSIEIVDSLERGVRGRSFENMAVRRVREVLGVIDAFPLSPAPPEALGALGGGAAAGGTSSGDGAGSDDDDNGGVGAASAGNDGNGDAGDDGEGGDGGDDSEEGAATGGAGRGGAAKTVDPTPVASVVPAYGGVGSWSHVLLAAPAGLARSAAQVDLGTGLDVNGFPILARLSASATDQLWSRVDPQRPSLDWRVNKPPRVSSLVNARAALGQLIGHEAPSGAACVPCSRGNGPFDSCRIVFLPSSGFQWSLACACCQYSGAANKCSLRASGDSSDTPRWVYRLVSLFQPNSILLKHPNLARHEAARQAAIKAKAGVPAPAVTSGDDKSKGKAKAVAGPSTPGKKRAAGESSAEKEKAGKRQKKKKKTKETPEPPGRVDATPRSGPVFDSVLYQTPLDWPMVYRAENEHWFMDVFERLREVRARTSHDYDAMRAVAISKGWWSQEDETSEEETDSGSSASADILNKAK
ncbi:hypothetical protein N7536_003135 [Penicillium majusculum]|nr:hypothetical protein N7536_003135 [Penicillium majusculum]